MTNTVDFALRYASFGWPVIPVEPGGKRPATRLVPHGVKDASAEAVKIRDWYGEQPEANVGIACSKFFVLDVDPRNGGDDTLEHG
jgi:hypothetical protein